VINSRFAFCFDIIIMSINIVLVDGRRLEVPALTASLPLAALKGQLVALSGIGYAEQRLVFAGVLMADDSRSLTSYGVESGTALHLFDATTGAAAAAATGAGAPALPAASSLPSPWLLHKSQIEHHRRHLLGVRFEEVQVLRVFGVGCNGAVLDCVARGVPVALKIMCVRPHF
jgi:hypothetical protein